MTKEQVRASLETKLDVCHERQLVVEGRHSALSEVQDALDSLQAKFDVQSDRLLDKIDRAERYLEEIDELETEEHVVENAKVRSMTKFATLK